MKKKKNQYVYFFISILVTIFLTIFINLNCDNVSINYTIDKLIFPLARLLFFIGIGLGLGQIIENSGWTKKMSFFARPIFKFSRLGDRCGAAFISAFFSGVVANGMLVQFFKEKKISRMQLFLTNYLNQLPAYFLHLPTTLFIVLPLTGFAGAIYFSLTFSAALLRFFLVIFFSKFYFSARQTHDLDYQDLRSVADHDKKQKNQGFVLKIKEKLIPRLIGIFTWVLPIYTLVFVLNALGIFDNLNTLISNKISTNILPVHSISVVVLSFAAEFTSGFAAAGALMDAGVISIKETAIALLLGNIIAFPIRALRHQIPRYLGIFSPKLGLSLLLTGQAFRIMSLIIIGSIYYMVA